MVPGGRPSTFLLRTEPNALLMTRTAAARVARRVTLASYFYKQKGDEVCLFKTLRFLLKQIYNSALLKGVKAGQLLNVMEA